MEACSIICGIFIAGAYLWTVYALWYAHCGQYEIDLRLKAIGKMAARSHRLELSTPGIWRLLPIDQSKPAWACKYKLNGHLLGPV